MQSSQENDKEKREWPVEGRYYDEILQIWVTKYKAAHVDKEGTLDDQEFLFY